MDQNEFDYIIIGAGSAGCVLANRLSADPKVRVCVIEGGGRESAPNVRVPAGILSLYGNPKYDYAYMSAPQEHLNGRRIPVNRGKALGGSSSINSMLYVRGRPSDYDEWRDLGCAGWGWDDVLPVFKDLEDNRIGQSPALHGTGGELHVDRARDPNPVDRIFIDAGRAVGLKENEDFNSEVQEGLGIYNVTQKDGLRWSSYRAFLDPVKTRPNLTILIHSETRRILVGNGRATGVEIAGEDGIHTLSARREVILAAGAIGSPTVLLRSGIGPGAMLKAAGVAVVHDLPGVGQNLRDHVDGMITVRSASTKTLGLSLGNLPAMIAAPFQLLFARKGMLETNYVEAGGFARTKYAGDEPDIQFHFVPGYRSHRDRLVEYGHGYAVHTCVLRPKSVGEIRLSPQREIEIDQKFFSDPQDAKVLTEGIKIARAIFADSAFDAIRGKEMLPGAEVASDSQILDYLVSHATTVYHPVGTCKMGRDALAVADPDTLKVHGIEGLRVADASIMPTLIGGNTNAPTMMIGERCARMILGTL
ncbi:GMC family oxidoreductase [Paenirhodobacter enshiensis]|uniref:Alcohol dehydrogenase n=1 Tax=Paenirhodobacter enshiensis TaxID=1105367 RepID=A0A086XZN5_9RHOB|nr:GMC family oxidoreductase N-terminal domain-containing protein [Paenirhodobacter enshiensis]KFI27485.1 alcohol dehydrogenase [Paenirhodobacter enshiensis]